MRISSLEVENFRAIRRVELKDLSDTVVIAGPNGCGKSCLLDAIRLLKSVYGGYQANEWHNWFGEFQINLQRFDQDATTLFQDKTKPLRMAAVFELSPREKAFLRASGRQILENSEWGARLPGYVVPGFGKVVTGARDVRRYGAEVAAAVEQQYQLLEAHLNESSYRVELTIDPGQPPRMLQSPIMEMVFSVYDPKNLGIIDYHGAQRAYQREQLGGVNLNIDQESERLKQHALYNYSNKYQNIKSEMATTLIRSLLAAQAGGEPTTDGTLIETIKELFELFFPGKRFVGAIPQKGGGLAFPVVLEDGSTHDIDELSAGEKEVVYGYLRLRTSAPHDSILLLDEPELHLNPRLIRGLPRFYQKHIAQALGNQLWLVTHSDAFLRQTVGQPGFTVLHMQPPIPATTPNQAALVRDSEALERIVIELVGDLASYRPGAKVLIFEGAKSEFDWRMTSMLFPRLVEEVNPISGGDKTTVRRLLGLLNEAAKAASLPISFYAIVDRDFDEELSVASDRVQTWDRYHIENYLLEDEFIVKAVQVLTLGRVKLSPGEVSERLRKAAQDSMPRLLTHKLRRSVRHTLITAVEPGIDPSAPDPAKQLAESARRAATKLKEAVEKELSPGALQSHEDRIRAELGASLSSDRWRSEFRGRDILRRFSEGIDGGVKYETLRNVILSQMSDANFQPIGMQRTIAAIQK